jgi:ABC-type glutathione transport system ATPase component
MKQDLVLNIENLEVSFEVKNIPYFVLRGVNFELYTKQKIAIVGESGSGKTTLANSILLFNDKKITTYFGNINFYPIKKM